MFKVLARSLLVSLALLPAAAAATEPVKLKLSFFSSDNAILYGGGGSVLTQCRRMISA